MRTLLLLLLIASPAAAKTWSDDGCSTAVTTEAKVFKYVKDTGSTVVCTVKDWPISSPVATMACNDGSAPKMEILSADQIRFDGITLTVPTDQNGICD